MTAAMFIRLSDNLRKCVSSSAGGGQQLFGQGSQDAVTRRSVGNAAMKTQRHPKSDPELRGVVVALCAVIVICAAVWAGAHFW